MCTSNGFGMLMHPAHCVHVRLCVPILLVYNTHARLCVHSILKCLFKYITKNTSPLCSIALMVPHSSYSFCTVMKTFTFSQHSCADLNWNYSAATLTNICFCSVGSDCQLTDKPLGSTNAVRHPRCLQVSLQRLTEMS